MRTKLMTIFAAFGLGMSASAFADGLDAQCEKDARLQVQKASDSTKTLKNPVAHYNRKLKLCLVTADVVQSVSPNATGAKPPPYRAIKGMLNVTDGVEMGFCIYFQEGAQISCGMRPLGNETVQQTLSLSAWDAAAAKLMRE